MNIKKLLERFQNEEEVMKCMYCQGEMKKTSVPYMIHSRSTP